MKYVAMFLLSLLVVMVFAAPSQEIRIKDVVIRNQGGILEARQGQKLLWQKQTPARNFTWIGWSGETILGWGQKKSGSSGANIVFAYALKTGREIWRTLEVNIEAKFVLSGRVLMYRVASSMFGAISRTIIRDSQTGRLLFRPRGDEKNLSGLIWTFEAPPGTPPLGIGNELNLELFNRDTFEVNIFRLTIPYEVLSYNDDLVCLQLEKRRQNSTTFEFLTTSPCGKTGFLYFKFPLDNFNYSKVMQKNPKVTVHQPPPLEYRLLSKPVFP